jgi:hypothetical protein
VALLTKYIAAYDTESAECLSACRRIRQVHEWFEFPATFFVVGKQLERARPEYRALLGDVPSFEIASHTYSHQMLRDHPFCGPAVEQGERIREVHLGKEVIEQTFGRPCWGMRPGCGFERGLRGDPWLVDVIADAGLGYVSSLLWGPETTVPALLEPPFSYVTEGHPELWELPGHGWHENLLKGHNLTVRPQRIIAWPFPFPEAVPPEPISTPEQEFAINRLFIDRAIESGLPYVSLIWHPWSLQRFDPKMTMLEMTLGYVRDRGLEPSTYAAEWQLVAGGGK